MSQSWNSLKLVRRVKVGGGILGPIAVSADALYIGDERQDIVRLNRTSLNATWRSPSQGFRPIRVCGEGSVFVGSLRKSQVGVIREDNGEFVWTRPALGGGATFWNGELILLELRGPQATTAPWSMKFVDPATGEVKDTIGLAGVVRNSGVCGDIYLYSLRDREQTIALDLRRRTIVWERNLLAEMREKYGIDEQGGPILTSGSKESRVIAVPLQRRGLFACSLEDGRILWHAPVLVRYSPNVHEERIYVLHDEHFLCVDEVTGTVIYDAVHPELRAALQAAAGTIHGDKIVIPSEAGLLSVLRTTDGKLVSVFEEDCSLWRTAEVDGRLLVTTGHGQLLVFEDEAGPHKGASLAS